jgi:hypothetical protein
MTHFARRHRLVRLILTVALAAGGLVLAALAQASSPVGAFTTKGAYKFISAPGLHPPKLKVKTHKSGLAPGDFLVANLPNEAAPGPMTGEGGPLILDNSLRPVWVYPVGTRVGSANLQQETYEPCGSSTCAEPVLVWWEGVVNSHGVTTRGKLFVVDQHYRRVATLSARAPWIISLHDASIVGQNIWVTVYRTVKNQNLASYGGAKSAAVLDVALQEYKMSSGKLLHTWDALNPGHKANLPLSNSLQAPPTPSQGKHGAVWDAYHLNSVQALQNGDLLVSMRNTWGVYLINPTTGKILWTLGGKHSTFKLAHGAKFTWQHHAELVGSAPTGMGSNAELTVFDDNCCKILSSGNLGSANGPSRGLALRLNTATKKASVIASYEHSPVLHTAFLGSMQLLPGGNALVGWGSLPYFSEYTKSGKQILDVQWPGKDESYRALFTNTWVGTPDYTPAVKLKNGTVYVSWNGATQVAKWEVLAGSSSSNLKVVASHARAGFETAIKLSKSYQAYEVQALDSHGHPLAHGSKTFS